jgi:hypothetical protein
MEEDDWEDQGKEKHRNWSHETSSDKYVWKRRYYHDNDP